MGNRPKSVTSVAALLLLLRTFNITDWVCVCACVVVSTRFWDGRIARERRGLSQSSTKEGLTDCH